jgi:TolB-like protein
MLDPISLLSSFRSTIMRCQSRESIALIIIAIAVSVFGAAPSAASKPAPDGKLNVAVMTLKGSSGISEGESGLISDRLRGELFNTGRANVMEREQMQEVLKEQGFQQSGTCTDEACLVQMGQLLGVQAIISGSMGKLGNMYLINLRIIDVQTGRIIQVVSEDIKGELEEVVGRLPGIAARLVGQAPPPPKKREPEVQAPKEEPRQKQPEPQVTTPVVQGETPAAVIDGEKEERNRNRAGLRFYYSMFPGVIDSRATIGTSLLSSISTSTSDSAMADSYNMASFDPSIMNKFALLFFIKAGKFINISIGPAFSFNSQAVPSYYSGYDNDGNYAFTSGTLTRTITITGIEPGVNFVKRFYPLKINAGLFADFDLLTINNDYTSIDTYNSRLDWTDSDVQLGFGGGARGGAEIMLGTHFGLNVDLIYHIVGFLSMGSDHSITYDMTPQMLGFGFGANIYF